MLSIHKKLYITNIEFRRSRLREILILAGWVALLVGCVEYDTGNRRAAETTRQAVLSLGAEADHGEIVAWAREMRAWINLTTGDYYYGVVAAARNGPQVTSHHSVAVQLFAQEAKAWHEWETAVRPRLPSTGQDPVDHPYGQAH